MSIRLYWYRNTKVERVNFGGAKVARELGAFRRQVLVPPVLPVTQAFRPAEERLTVPAVLFRR